MAKQHVILFYQYHPLSSEENLVELYRQALETLCSSLELKGRILVGCNPQQSEGINGTLSSKSLENLQLFGIALQYHQPNIEKEEFEALLPSNVISASCSTEQDDFFEILSSFWKSCQDFYEQASCTKPLTIDETELKWSVSSDTTADLFPDLNVKMVAELIGSGGILATINPNDVPAEQRGYLTPAQWHERMQQLQQNDSSSDDTVLIDCRNTKEVQIGNFGSGTTAVVDPNTTTFQQFPQWVTQNTHKLQHKKVLMYCTGGIRCEKSSAYIKQVVPSVQEVSHLQGGIHKYLEEFSDSKSSTWQGKNFVFDRRGTAEAVKLSDLLNNKEQKEDAKTDQTQKDTTKIVGQCIHCQAPYDTFHPHCVCTVCREPVLACESCQTTLKEYHCHNHQHLNTCYFTNLSKFTIPELQEQYVELEQLLEPIAVGKQYRQKRSTLRKQLEKVQARMQELEVSSNSTPSTTTSTEVCRSCGAPNCAGDCWGYFGLKRKQALEKKHETASKCSTVMSTATTKIHLQQTQLAKKRQRQEQLDDMVELGMCAPPSQYWNASTNIRQPPACTRVLQTTTKGKWCGKSLLHVLQHEFQELASSEHLEAILENGLLRLNDTTIESLEQAEQTRLKNMDVIRRIVHWHEPPVLVPESIGIKKISLSQAVLDDYGITLSSHKDDAVVYICDKPSTVPVHPAGPYLSNALTSMVEGQLSLEPKSLIPCHRIDRVTSGLTLCCTNNKVANVLQTRIAQGSVEKLYLAKVHGKFPGNSAADSTFPKQQKIELASWSWCKPEESLESDSSSSTLQVDGPIETVDAANGIRQITAKGKPATSLFQLLKYDTDSDSSILYCRPKTGRSHQLRVHLQYLGFPIVNDLLYGGRTEPGGSVPLEDIQAPSISAPTSELKSKILTEQDVNAARSCCKVCQQNTMEAGFTKAQLLQEGHSICLHALRYVVNILPKKPKDGQDPLQILTAEVDPPSWSM